MLVNSVNSLSFGQKPRQSKTASVVREVASEGSSTIHRSKAQRNMGKILAAMMIPTLFPISGLASCAQPVSPTEPVDPTQPTQPIEPQKPTLSAVEQNFLDTMSPLNPSIEYVDDEIAAKGTSATASPFKGYNMQEYDTLEENTVTSVSDNAINLDNKATDIQTGLSNDSGKMTLSGATGSRSRINYDSGAYYDYVNLGDGTVKRIAAGDTAHAKILKPKAGEAGTVLVYDLKGALKDTITNFKIRLSKSLMRTIK